VGRYAVGTGKGRATAAASEVRREQAQACVLGELTRDPAPRDMGGADTVNREDDGASARWWGSCPSDGQGSARHRDVQVSDKGIAG
jgi:hypothetical protein